MRRFCSPPLSDSTGWGKLSAAEAQPLEHALDLVVEVVGVAALDLVLEVVVAGGQPLVLGRIGGLGHRRGDG